ncbi:NEDD8 ultimate buster 1 [Pseudolycoriella hygida]|uniref:NEDD8 ultimate buster 1 n=1 Tax=Pseudolycoriella hygida TaxID=35572 RepID=A0A9Q0MVB3_9DIPT|nr:NEDD8 ultimate buster 1 [Pseudolycoriella hygida]
MSGILRIDNVLMQVKGKLQENRVKLWLSPYYEDGIGAVDDEIERLSISMAQELNVPVDYCKAALSELQNNALDKLRAQAEFAETGLATIKVRAPNQVGGTRLITINVKLTEIGSTLQELVAKELGTCPLSVKLISAGKVINSHQVLSEQNIKNNQQIMALTLKSSENLAEDAAYNKVQKAREDAQLLINQNEKFMDMEDQKGNAIHLPPEEKNSLMMALAMHEKGRAELKKKNYTDALLFLLDADNEFSHCNSKLLETVDNYALLNLDIAWCYLCLKSVMQLPAAERRLQICESKFKESYGENLDRVMFLKGCTGNEKALIMRLHLLQAIVLYHQNRRYESQSLLLLAESELNQLKISDESVNAIVEMGKSSRRAARKRSRKEQTLLQQVSESKDKTWVNPRSLADLVDMGFPSELCVVALQLSNNKVDDAIDMLRNNHTALEQKVVDDFIPNSSIVDQMTKMGFHPDIIQMSLRKAKNNLIEAVEMLLSMQSDGTYANLLSSILPSSSSTTPSTSALSAITSMLPTSSQDQKLQDHANAMKAFKRFSDGVSSTDDDYLDFALDMEENFIAEYKSFLSL